MKKKTLKGEGPRGMSIHIGLNHVDAAAYDGWDGALAGCINDANAMEGIARDQGYEPISKLLDGDATADAVLEAIGRAAQELQPGDQLLLTYSGHGGQVPDDTGEEEDGKDETWVLYDRQLLDNELYAMWGQFAAGVRIFVLSDSCHSGTVLRMAKAKKDQQAVHQARGKKGLLPAFRLMPYEKAEKNYKDNLARYRDVQWLTSGARRRSADEVAASVLLISGCQDNQFSQDGDENGLFTQTLLGVWKDGDPQDYRDFFEKIRAGMPSEQTPNYFTVGAFDADFENARPFVIIGAPAGGDDTRDVEAGPSIKGPDTVDAAGGPPTFQVEPGPLGYYVIEVATDPAFFYGGSGGRTAANAYGSWTDVHQAKRGSAASFTLPAAAWQALKKAKKLYYRMHATDQATGGWGSYRLVDGAAPIAVTPSRALETPVEPPPLETPLLPPAAARAAIEQQAR